MKVPSQLMQSSLLLHLATQEGTTPYIRELLYYNYNPCGIRHIP